MKQFSSQANQPIHRTNSSRIALYAILFFASGFSALIYQVVWQRQLQLYFGVATYSVILIVAAYMGGLGLGSLWGGRLSRFQKLPLRSYGLLELGIGAFAMLSPQLLSWVGRQTAGASFFLVFTISFAVLLIPTTLMGMTLPMLTQGFVKKVDQAGRVVGLLYGINTLGSAFGALLAGYILIGAMGLTRAVYLGAGINILVGLSAFLVANTRALTFQEDGKAAALKRAATNWSYAGILLASFLTGFIGLGYEMLWMRILGVVNKQSVYTFPSILFVLLLGLSLGGMVWGRAADRSRAPGRLLWLVSISVGLTSALSALVFLFLLDSPQIAENFHSVFKQMQNPVPPFVTAGEVSVFSPRLMLLELTRFFAPIVILMVPACFIQGGGVVILDRIAIDSPGMSGRRVGDVHLANISGSVAGILVVSLVFLPSLGTEITLKVLVAASLVFLGLDKGFARKSGIMANRDKTAIGMAAGLLLAMVILPGKTAFYEKIYQTGEDGPITVEEGRDSVLALSWHDEQKTEPNRLWIGGELHSLYPISATYQSFALACTAVKQPESVLIIGLGGGNTAEYFMRLDGIRDIVMVELIDNLPSFLEDRIPFVREMLSDPRVELISDDGRRYLFANRDKKYDLIVMDPLRHYTSGSNNLYSLEAMQAYREQLTPDGVLCAWKDEYHIIPNTAAQVFPYLDDFDRFMIGRNQPIHYDFAAMQKDAEEATASMHPEVVLGSYLRDRKSILSQEGGNIVLADHFPYLEYYFLRTPAIARDRFSEEDWPLFLDRVDRCDSACSEAISASR